jgi:hypothetical protein
MPFFMIALIMINFIIVPMAFVGPIDQINELIDILAIAKHNYIILEPAQKMSAYVNNLVVGSACTKNSY